ncbi:MAG: type II toxin-antitoxin system VapC family toxin [Dermatophilaceae bacterium]
MDASVLANAVGDDQAAGRTARTLLRDNRELAAPDLVDVETVAVLRRWWLAGTVTDQRFEHAVVDLADLPVTRFPVSRFMRRAFELRHNITAYDSCYVAVAEVLGCALYTADHRLVRAPGPQCVIRLVS